MFRHFILLIALAALPSFGDARPGVVDDGDAQVIQALKDAGADLTKPHETIFYFVGFADRRSAERLSKELDPNWKIDIHQSPDSSEWTVIASTRMVPEIHAMSELTVRFNALAAKFGGDYDGWEAAVSP